MKSRCATPRCSMGAICLAVVALASNSWWNETRAAPESAVTTAERLVAEAGAAAARGDSGGQFALLREALRIAPDYKAARWQLGQVEHDGQWLSVEQAQQLAANDPRQEEYGSLRELHGEALADQLSLARWCRRNGLPTEARFHWASVLSIDANHPESLRALGMRWHDGRLVGRDEIKDEQQEQRANQRAIRRWSASVARWDRMLTIGNESAAHRALDGIRALSDPAAIAAVERLSLDAGDTSAARVDAKRRISLALISALDEMTDQQATESLVRHAVLSPIDDVRQASMERLRYRRLHDFVPLLLDSLAATIESSYSVVIGDDGTVHYSHSLYREGPFADWSYDAARSGRLRGSPAQISARLAANTRFGIPLQTVDDRNVAVRSRMATLGAARRYQVEARAAERRVAEENRLASIRNARITTVLANVIDQDLGSEPRDWWDWWQDYNEYDRSEDRPVLAQYESGQDYFDPPPPPQSSRSECFSAGTLVWTKTGQRPIEEIELGDLVLAQDVDTGELTYQPVIGRTVRPPSPILRLQLRGEALHTTRGHPFWVPGSGWQMAKELKEGAVLHAVTGSTQVVEIEELEAAEAYNLVVADFNTYFVGESGILVHDNTPRRPTRAVVPGLIEQR